MMDKDIERHEGDEEEEIVPKDYRSPRSVFWERSALLCFAIILALSLVAIAFGSFDLRFVSLHSSNDMMNTKPHHNHDNPPLPTPTSYQSQPLNCGKNVEDARSAGCIYDVIAQAWTPKACYPASISEKYMAMSDWTFFTVSEAIEPGATSYATQDNVIVPGSSKLVKITVSEIEEGKYTHMWTTNAFHVAHCLYAWERYMYAKDTGQLTDNQAVMGHHAAHCSGFALAVANGTFSSEGVQTEVQVGFHHCVEI